MSEMEMICGGCWQSDEAEGDANRSSSACFLVHTSGEHRSDHMVESENKWAQ